MSYQLLDKNKCVLEYISAYNKFNKDVLQVQGKPIIIKKNFDKNKVAIISGGGSGHEPTPAGLVGQGLLTASVSGMIFTSPSPSDILEAINLVGLENKGGVLLIVLNYTGDRINFGIAANRARKLGITVEMIIVGEDSSNKEARKTAGRRGLAGSNLIFKLAGSMSEEGQSLEKIKSKLNSVIKENMMGTIGISFSGCNIPFTESKSFVVPDNNFIVGLGIHGEIGVKTEKMQDTKTCISTVINYLLDNKINSVNYKKGDAFVVLINNLGNLISLELYSFAVKVFDYLEKQFGVKVIRGYCGCFVTSLDMKGVSITILNAKDPDILKHLDSPSKAPFWPQLIYAGDKVSAEGALVKSISTEIIASVGKSCKEMALSDQEFQNIRKVILGITKDLIKAEEYLNDLDREIGDSDCGSTVKRGALAVHDYLTNDDNCKILKNIPELFSKISSLLENSMGGTSGGLLSLYFEDISVRKILNSQMSWSSVFLEATKHLSEISQAIKGDRTMLDVLFPIAEEWERNKTEPFERILVKLVKIAEDASKSTIKMIPKAGRASYTNKKLEYFTKPDPGAELIYMISKSLSHNLKS